MKKAAIILASGFEECEAIAPFDILKRGKVDVYFIGLNELEVKGAHGVKIVCDGIFGEFEFKSFDIIILPGGMPGANHLADSMELKELLWNFAKAGKYCAAICAAPMVLAKAGIIKDKYTCYPGFESHVNENAPSKEKVVIDGKIITSKGPGTAYDFGLALLEILEGKQTRDEVASGMLLA